MSRARDVSAGALLREQQQITDDLLREWQRLLDDPTPSQAERVGVLQVRRALVNKSLGDLNEEEAADRDRLFDLAFPHRRRRRKPRPRPDDPEA